MRWILVALGLMTPAWAEMPAAVRLRVEAACVGCHAGAAAQGGLDLRALPFTLDQTAVRERWVRVYDRVERGEMPPRGGGLPAAERQAFLSALAPPLEAADRADVRAHGRGPMRRLNREEYEQNLRDVLALPGLAIREMLPEDREAHHFTKTAAALDVSRVQLTAYLDAAEAALRQAMVTTAGPPPVTTYRARGRNLFPGVRSTGTLKSMFFIQGDQGVHVEKEWGTPLPKVFEEDPSLEMGLFRSPGWPYGAFPVGFAARAAGEYRVRFSARAVLQQEGYRVTAATKPVPMTLRRRRPTNHDIAEDVVNVGGTLEITPGPHVYEVTVPLGVGQTIEWGLLGLPVPQVDAEGKTGSYRFPPFPPGGAPGVAFHWLEITGPLAPESWPPASHRVLFDELGVDPRPQDAKGEARRLLRRFVERAGRGPAPEAALERFMALVQGRLAQGERFAEAMLTGYQAVLCSDLFLYLRTPRERFAVADRLAHFLTNSRPDGELAGSRLEDRAVLRRETERLVAGAGFERFVKTFADSWLQLRHLRRDDADKRLYPEYQLDEHLVESMERETLATLTALVRENRPVTELVQADYAYVNERLARHYGLPGVEGAAVRRVGLPAGSVRGGLLTQGAVLKVTANGTGTSPVLRGAWVMDRILGEPPPPPPPGVPAVEPDIRGAKTIREQLALHTKQAACAGCHARFDPAGLALESFDVMGRWRSHYRGTAEGEKVTGIDHTGHDFAYTVAGAVDASGKLLDGRSFRDVKEFKALLAAEPRRLARNLLRQWTVYATGTPVRFADRAEVERILDASAAEGFRVRDLLVGLVGSKIFLESY
jgi:hypothetical protein